jgi:release factor glutamine methyltransferase
MRMNADRRVPEDRAEQYLSVIRRRIRGEPVAYLTGEQEFMSLAFKVEPGVLIPRKETEILVEKVIEHCRSLPEFEGLDVGTGCGCIPISVLKHLPGADAHFTAVDISPKALGTAFENSKMHRVDDRIEFMASDLFSSLPRTLSYDLITANLPYVTEEEFTRTALEVRNYEPASAITGGKDGLDLIRRFADQAWRFLRSGGLCFIEIGWTQAEQVKTLFSAVGQYIDIHVFSDYSGNDRVVTAVKGGRNG